MNADSLPILLRSLELTAMERECEGAIVRAEAENWGYRRLLQYLTEAEVQDRRTRKIERLLKSVPRRAVSSGFGHDKCGEHHIEGGGVVGSVTVGGSRRRCGATLIAAY